MRKFLPPGDTYNISAPDHDAFTHEDAGLLERIGNGMSVRKAHTSGRIPSPVSRAYMFYANLFLRSFGQDASGDGAADESVSHSSGREALQEDARRTFRGLLATFAMRDVLDLSINFQSVTLTANKGHVSEVLVPALRATPGGREMWNPIQFYTLRSNGSTEVLAGRSPLTGLFPSATAPSTLSGVYWYDYDEDSGTAEWYDPTGPVLDEADEFRVSSATRQKVKGLIKAWLNHVMDDTTTAALEQEGINMQPRDAQRLVRELERWHQELGNVSVPDNVEVVSNAIADEPGVTELPFLSYAIRATPDYIWSDLPLHEGRLIVTFEDLRSKTKRIYGRQFGGSAFEQRIERLPESGDNLGQALGLGEKAISMPFLFIDRLFTPNLTLLTLDELSREWEGLEVDNGGQAEYFLIPLEPEILEIMDREALRSSLSAKLSNDGQNYIVQLTFGQTTITKLYSTFGKGNYCLDEVVRRNEFDLRLFPDYDLDSVRHLLVDDDGEHVDDQYYARVRISPTWPFDHVSPFVKDAGKVRRDVHDEPFVMGNDSKSSTDKLSPGKAVFYAISERPDGFFVPERGFCLTDLDDPRGSGVTEGEWSVGVDFGTSNTCVAYKKSEDADPDILRLPVLTTSLLKRPDHYVKFGPAESPDFCEGGSAVLDFFHRYGDQDESLMSQLYFPTQLLTQQQSIESDDTFDIRNGLIYFDNISLADLALLSLVNGYPQKHKDLVQRFSVKQDIKWERTDWLRVFMHHLRKHVVLTAAKKNARIKELHFSYPKSFDFQKRRDYKADLHKVWRGRNGVKPQLSSESEAARDFVVRDRNQHVIFDIGGGTTDIIAFDNQEPVFQTSFKLAAGQINDYIVESPVFREKFVEAMEKRAKEEVVDELSKPLLKAFQATTQKRRKKEIVLQLWLGLLQQITDADYDNSGEVLARILNRLRTEAEAGGPIQGFFLSNLLMLGGVSYYAGQLLRLAADGKIQDGESFSLSQVTITLTGNGSRLYNMLDIDEHPFSEIMEKMFLRGLGVTPGEVPIRFDGLYEYEGEPAPKVTVALGLLREGEGAKLDDVPVANIVGEQGYAEPLGETEYDSSLVSYYQAVQKKEVRFDPPQLIPENLERFIDGLDEDLPYGMHGEFEVIPNAKKDWSEQLKDRVYRRAIPRIKDRGYANAELAKGIEKEPENKRPALEPLFVAEIVGMIDAVRDLYAE